MPQHRKPRFYTQPSLPLENMRRELMLGYPKGALELAAIEYKAAQGLSTTQNLRFMLLMALVKDLIHADDKAVKEELKYEIDKLIDQYRRWNDGDFKRPRTKGGLNRVRNQFGTRG